MSCSDFYDDREPGVVMHACLTDATGRIPVKVFRAAPSMRPFFKYGDCARLKDVKRDVACYGVWYKYEWHFNDAGGKGSPKSVVEAIADDALFPHEEELFETLADAVPEAGSKKTLGLTEWLLNAVENSPNMPCGE